MRYLEKIFHVLVLSIAIGFGSSVALADYTLVVPQKPGGGTSVWAQIVAKEWEKLSTRLSQLL